MEMLVEISPLNAGTGSRVTLRLASAMDKRIVALNSVRWWPAIKRKAALSHQFFDGDFTGQIGTGGASFQVSMFALKRLDAAAAGYRYARAPVTIYAAEPGTAWPWPVVFKGVVDRFGNADETLQLDCIVDATPFDVSALTLTYAGTGGIEGPADLKNKVKPWCFGQARGVEPVLIDAANIIYQVSGYGPINGVTALYERAASFGASVGDFANYGALVAASIPAGRWATCLALGLIRLGAPAAGLITADVEGDKPGGVYLRRTGAIISRLCSNAGVSAGSINAASLAALDTWASGLAAGGNINLYLTEQVKLKDLIERLVRPCNAMAGVSWAGELFACRFGTIGSPAVTLDVQGRFLPPVRDCSEEPVSPPYTRIEAGADRCWRPHATNEIAFFADIVERGDYAAGTSYREGNIAVSQGARWLYINPTATIGNAPPTLPTSSNSFWDLLQAPPAYGSISGVPTNLAAINSTEGTKLTGIESGANVTETRTAAAVTGQGALATSNVADWPTQVTGTGKPTNYADVTGTNTAAAIAGQGALATQNTVDWATQIIGAAKVAGNLITDPITLTDLYFPDGNASRQVNSTGTRLADRFRVYMTANTYFGWMADPGSTRIPVFPGQVIFYQHAVFTTSNTGSSRGLFNALNAEGTYVGTYEFAGSSVSAAPSNGAWVVAKGSVTIPAGVAFIWPHASSVSLDSPAYFGEPFVGYHAAGADITAINTAAAIAGQGALATLNSADWATRVSGTGKPANNADVTAANTAAAIAGQAPWATYMALVPSTVAGQVSRLQTDGYIFANTVYGYYGQLDTVYPGEFGANKTETRVAASISGQGALATRNTVDFATDITGVPPGFGQQTVGNGQSIQRWMTSGQSVAVSGAHGATTGTYGDRSATLLANGSVFATGTAFLVAPGEPNFGEVSGTYTHSGGPALVSFTVGYSGTAYTIDTTKIFCRA